MSSGSSGLMGLLCGSCKTSARGWVCSRRVSCRLLVRGSGMTQSRELCVSAPNYMWWRDGRSLRHT